MKDKDYYPTRKFPTGRFIKRVEPVSYFKPALLSIQDYSFYRKNGYLVIKDFFDKTQVRECLINSDTDKGLITKDIKIDAKRSITGIHLDEPFRQMSKNDNLVSIVKSILGSDIYIHQSRINYKAGLGANGWYWHSDFETWHSQDGMPTMRCLSAMIPLTANTECNGSLMVIPGSHKYFYSCKKEKSYSAMDNFADQKEGVPETEALYKFFEYSNNRIEMVKCEPSDLVLFDCNTIHVSTQNMTPLARTNLFFVYNSLENQLQDPFSTDQHRPEQMGTTQITEIL